MGDVTTRTAIAPEVVQVDRFIADLARINREFKNQTITIDECNKDLRELTSTSRLYAREVTAIKRVQRLQNLELNTYMSAIRQVGYVTRNLVSIYQTHTLMQMRMERQTRDVRDAQSELSDATLEYNRYLKHLGVENSYVQQLYIKMRDAEHRLSDEQKEIAKSTNDMRLGYLLLGTSVASTTIPSIIRLYQLLNQVRSLGTAGLIGAGKAALGGVGIGAGAAATAALPVAMGAAIMYGVSRPQEVLERETQRMQISTAMQDWRIMASALEGDIPLKLSDMGSALYGIEDLDEYISQSVADAADTLHDVNRDTTDVVEHTKESSLTLKDILNWWKAFRWPTGAGAGDGGEGFGGDGAGVRDGGDGLPPPPPSDGGEPPPSGLPESLIEDWKTWEDIGEILGSTSEAVKDQLDIAYDQAAAVKQYLEFQQSELAQLGPDWGVTVEQLESDLSMSVMDQAAKVGIRPTTIPPIVEEGPWGGAEGKTVGEINVEQIFYGDFLGVTDIEKAAEEARRAIEAEMEVGVYR